MGDLGLPEERPRRTFKAVPLRLTAFVTTALLLPTGVLASQDASQAAWPSAQRSLRGQSDGRRLTDACAGNPSFCFAPDLARVVLYLPDGPLQCSQALGCQRITGLYAGLEIETVRIEIVGSDYDFNFVNGRIRIAYGDVDTEDAQAGLCAKTDLDNSTHIATVDGDWAYDGATIVSGDSSTQIAVASGLVFKKAGKYRLCYSNEGDFSGDDVDVFQMPLEVYGVFDNRPECAKDETCLTKRPYRCYLLREAYGNMHNNFRVPSSCIVDFSYDGAGNYGPAGRGSWSSAFGVTYGSGGIVDSVTPAACAADGAVPAPILCGDPGAADTNCYDGVLSVETNASVNNQQFTIPAGRADLHGDTFQATTVAACYCPGGYVSQGSSGACTQPSEFLQQVGILHFYVSKVCFAGFRASSSGWRDFTGVSPQMGFSLRVECPTDACNATGQSRMKLVTQKAANDLPSWDPNSGCGTAVHGVREYADGSSTLVLPPAHNPNVATSEGAIINRQDYKAWNFWNDVITPGDDAESGFLFVMGSSAHELRSGQEGVTWDVCYCDDNCEDTANWFKVGQLRYAPYQLVAAAESYSTEQEDFAVEYAMQPGVIAFWRPIEDHGVMGLQENGTVKLVSDPTMQASDSFCVDAPYDASLVDGPSSFEQATLNFGGSQSMDGERLILNSGNMDNRITVKKSGVVAICYCAFVDASLGRCQDNQWVFTQHITVRGPGTQADGQFFHWEFSTHVVFRFEYQGFGLSAGDKLRIIPPTSECSDSNGNPSGAYTQTFVKLQCPDPCSNVGDVDSAVNGDISATLLSDSTWGCDKNGENCGSNDIKKIIVISDTQTEVHFENAHGLTTGDLISIGAPGDNIICSPSDPMSVCNDERLAVVKGQYRFADQNNSIAAAEVSVAGHAITTTSDPTIVTIPVGWPEPRPTFAIEYSESKRGKWVRHSKAITAEEIMGTQTVLNMKVCWRYAQRNNQMSPRYVSQAGTISLINPFTFSDARVSLTSAVKSQTLPTSPLIVSFKTGVAQTGARYGQVTGSTRLRLLFRETAFLNPRFNDGGNIVAHKGEDELGEAKQYICGKIFREMWSSDNDYGFPLPRGCFYKVYGSTREIVLLFDPRNGLRAGMDYQLVLNAVLEDGAVKGGQYLEILTMDDTDLYPYRAIERGLAVLQTTPKDGAFGDSGVKFAGDGGMRVAGGEDEPSFLKMLEGTTFSVTLRGDTTGGGIKASSILRIFMWPLTQWDMESTCQVTCEDYNIIDARCGTVQTCKGSATVTNFQRNYIEVKLPASMATIDETVSHKLHFHGLKFPVGGVFPTHVGAEISKSDDTKPHYIESIGALLYKPPEEGRVVGRLVDFFGDGNLKPFAGDQSNVLYANIVLAATLYSVSQTGDAQMKLTLPKGYTCVMPDTINGESGWKNQDELGVFGGVLPQGIGAPDDPDAATRGWFVDENTCTYKLRQNSAIFAGTSLMVRVTVNNPTEAMQKDDDANSWQVTLSSKGHGALQVEFPAVAFATIESSFGKAVPVLGHVTDASLVPTNFAETPAVYTPSQGELRVWFRAQQSTGVFSRVHLRTPDGFGLDPCVAHSLEDSYYATHGEDNTRRLPGILSCAYYTDPYSHVEVRLSGAVLAGERYAFSVTAVNPMSFTPGATDGWMVYTVSREGFQIDGTEKTLRFLSPNISESFDWGGNLTDSYSMYRTEINYPTATCAAVAISNMIPYSVSGSRATVTVSPLCSPQQVTTNLRIVAPEGFVWDFADSEYGTGSQTVPGSQSVPGGVPLRERNVLLWPTPVTFQSASAATYSFEAKIRVPDVTPTETVNDFIFEFGYDATTVQGRAAASVVTAPQVRALTNVALDYTSNVEREDMHLIFQFQTVTDIPSGAYLEIVGPAGYVVANPCVLEKAPQERGSPYVIDPMAAITHELPSDAMCSSRITGVDVAAEDPGVRRIKITAGAQGIKAGLYRFQIAATTPERTDAPVPDVSKPCGYSCCWDFTSRLGNQQMTPAQYLLDAPLSIPCFGVNMRMAGGGMPVLTDVERQATGRDDRPLMYSPVVFTVVLERDSLYAATLRIRGPDGVVFQEDCEMDIETSAMKVFGDNTALSPNYEEWPAEVKITSCRGEGPDAYLRLQPEKEGTDGLAAGYAYPFRLAIFKNPLLPPARNYWTIEYNGESTTPFQGYDLWTFSGVSLDTVSTGRSTSVAGDTKFANPVTITFNPQNTISGPGVKLVVTAPEFYQFAHVSYTCRVLIQPIGNHTMVVDGVPTPNYVGPPALVWGDGDTDCHVDALTLRVLTVTTKADKELIAGEPYQITVFVNNPTFKIPTPGTWTLQSHQSPGEAGGLATSRDLAAITGYVVDDRPNQFMYLNSADIRGKAQVLDLYFEFAMPYNLEAGENITVEAPKGFDLEMPGQPGTCNGFQWDATNPDSISDKSPVNCTTGALTIQIDEDKNVKEGILFKFRINTKNPVETPHEMENNWKISHVDASGAILATEALASWEIVSQLAEVEIDLVGSNRAAGQLSTIAVSFMPVSTADELYLEAKQPQFVSFTGAAAISTGHEVIATADNSIRVQAAIRAGIRTTIVLDEMTLGSPGGQTVFSLVTKLNNGLAMDESLNFAGGFVQPGLLTVRNQMIESEFNLDPVAYPVSSVWDSRMGENALATFVVANTMETPAGSTVVVASLSDVSGEYELKAQDFQVRHKGSGAIIQTENITAVGSKLTADLLGRLIANTDYEIRLSVEAPTVASELASSWRIEAYQDYNSTAEQLLNTNDAETPAFRLVDSVLFEVTSYWSPPSAEIEARIKLDAQSTRPTELIVVAPDGFNFTDDCLVQGGFQEEIVSCKRHSDLAGRATAKIACREGGLSGEVTGVIIKVITPENSAAEPSWYVEALDSTGQVGWGRDPVGFPVVQMLGSDIVYSGVPDMSGWMVIGFITQKQVPAGGTIVVGYPSNNIIQCDGAFFAPLRMRGNYQCTTGVGFFQVTFDYPISIGQQAFAVTSTPPDAIDPGPNEFYIKVIGPSGDVIDAAMGIPGLPIQHGLPITAQELIWSTSAAGSRSITSLGFELLDILPAQSPPIVAEVVVQMPPDFVQQVANALNVEQLEGDLPYASGTWLDVSDPGKLVIILDEQKVATLTPGGYRFSFPVTVPSRIPSYNMWIVTLCKPREANSTATSCTGWKDPRALVSLPVTGFNLGDEHPKALQYDAASAAFRTVSLPAAPLLLAAVLCLMTRLF